MADAKTQMTDADPAAFIAAVEPARKRDDAVILDALFRRVTGERPKMWGLSIIGYGEYRTVYASGRAVHWLRTGFSPRKAKHSLYLMACNSGAAEVRAWEARLARLGKHTRGKSCLYINRLADVDMGVLEEMIAADWAAMARLYPD